MRLATRIAWLSAALAGCGGGGSLDSPPPQEPPPAIAVSPGGHWRAVQQGAQSNIYITETGTVGAVFETAPATVPLIGSGSVTVAANGDVAGTLQAANNQPTGNPLACSLSGTLQRRVSLVLDVTCSSNGNIVFDRTLPLVPQPGYEIDSSLAKIAGNYTLPIQLAPNSLNIAADGTVFGQWDSGVQCTVNGRVRIIDADWNLYAVEWQFTGCSGPFPGIGDSNLSGLAFRQSGSTWPDGTHTFVLTGISGNQITALAVTYVPN